MKNPIKMDDLGVPPFQETSMWPDDMNGGAFDCVGQVRYAKRYCFEDQNMQWNDHE